MATPPNETETRREEAARQEAELHATTESQTPPVIDVIADSVDGEKASIAAKGLKDEQHEQEQSKYGSSAGTINSLVEEKEKEKVKAEQRSFEGATNAVSAVGTAVTEQLQRDLKELDREIKEQHREIQEVLETADQASTEWHEAKEKLDEELGTSSAAAWGAFDEIEDLEKSGASEEEIEAAHDRADMFSEGHVSLAELKTSINSRDEKASIAAKGLKDEHHDLSEQRQALNLERSEKGLTESEAEKIDEEIQGINDKLVKNDSLMDRASRYAANLKAGAQLVTKIALDKEMLPEDKLKTLEALKHLEEFTRNEVLTQDELLKIKEVMPQVNPESDHFKNCENIFLKSEIGVETKDGKTLYKQEAADYVKNEMLSDKLIASAKQETPADTTIAQNTRPDAPAPKAAAEAGIELKLVSQQVIGATSLDNAQRTCAGPATYECYADSEAFNKHNPAGETPTYAAETQNNAPDIGTAGDAYSAAIADTGDTGKTGTETNDMEDLLERMKLDQENAAKLNVATKLNPNELQHPEGSIS